MVVALVASGTVQHGERRGGPTRDRGRSAARSPPVCNRLPAGRRFRVAWWPPLRGHASRRPSFRRSSGSLLLSRIARVPLTTKQPATCPHLRQVAAPADPVAPAYLVRWRSLLLA